MRRNPDDHGLICAKDVREVPLFLEELEDRDFTRESARSLLEDLLGPGSLEQDTKLRVAIFLDSLRSGETRVAACARSGLEWEMIAFWMASYREFLHAVEFCEAEAERLAVEAVRKAMRGGELVKKTTLTRTKGRKVEVVEKEEHTQPDWRAAAWLLERRNPQHWGEKKRIDVHSLTDQQVIAILQTEIIEGGPAERTQDTAEGDSD